MKKAKKNLKKLETKQGKIQATKHDIGKIQFLFPIRALAETNRVFTYGGKKYDIGNWHSGDGFDWQRLIDAAYGHIGNFQLGENYDKETKMYHLAHAMCCLAMLLEHQIVNLGNDTRSKTNHFTDVPFDTRSTVKIPNTKGKKNAYR